MLSRQNPRATSGLSSLRPKDASMNHRFPIILGMFASLLMAAISACGTSGGSADEGDVSPTPGGIVPKTGEVDGASSGTEQGEGGAPKTGEAEGASPKTGEGEVDTKRPRKPKPVNPVPTVTPAPTVRPLPPVTPVPTVKPTPVRPTAPTFRAPLSNYRVTSVYGPRRGRLHEGIDLGAPFGREVLSVAAGIKTSSRPEGACGNVVRVAHSVGENRFESRYCHLSAYAGSNGRWYPQWTLIGRIGLTGRTAGPHLHLEIRRNGVVQNPAWWIKF
jgi:murein DD-endopeptidase MepM/ murein hydrolase activator NlpD